MFVLSAFIVIPILLYLDLCIPEDYNKNNIWHNFFYIFYTISFSIDFLPYILLPKSQASKLLGIIYFWDTGFKNINNLMLFWVLVNVIFTIVSLSVCLYSDIKHHKLLNCKEKSEC